jgi:hypothetical protein
VTYLFLRRTSHSGRGRASLPLIVYTGTAELEIFIVAADGSVAVVQSKLATIQKSSNGSARAPPQVGRSCPCQPPALTTCTAHPSRPQTSPNAASLCLCDQTALLAGIRGGSGCSKQSRDPHSPAATPAPRVATSPAIHPSPQSVPARPPARAAATMLHSRSTSTHHAAPIAPVSPSPLLDTAATR